MLTADPQGRASKLAELMDILRRDTPAEDRDLVLALAPVMFADMPDRLALGLPVQASGRPHPLPLPLRRPRDPARPSSSTRDCPASTWARGAPSEAEARAIGAGHGLPLEIHGGGDPHRRHPVHLREPQELLPEGRPSRLLRDPPHLHRAPAVGAHRVDRRLRTTRAARSATATSRSSPWNPRSACGGSSTRSSRCSSASSWPSRTSRTWVGSVGSWAGRVRGRARQRDRAGLGPRVPRLAARRQLHLHGDGRYRVALGRPARPRGRDARPACSRTRRCSPWSSPGLMEQVESHLMPRRGRRPHHRHRLLQQRLGDLPPRADRRHRGPRVGAGRAARWRRPLLLGRFAKGAFAQRADRHPPPQGEARLAAPATAAPSRTPTPSGRSAPPSTASPSASSSTPTSPSLKEIIDRIVYMTGDDEIAVHVRNGRGLRGPLHRLLARCATRTRPRRRCGRALADAFGPISFATSVDCGAVTLLIFYFDAAAPRAAHRRGEVRRLTARPRHHLGGPGRGRPREGVRRARGPAALPRATCTCETRSGLYRESTPPEQVPDGRPPLREPGRAPRGPGHPAHRRDGGPEALLGAPPRAHRHPAHAPEPRPHRDRGAAHPARAARGAQVLPVPLRASRRRTERIAALHLGRGALRRRPARPRRGARHRRPAQRPHPPGRPRPGGEVEVLRTLRNHLLQIRTHYNVETVNGVLLRNSARGGRALPGFRGALRPAAARRPRGGAWPRPRRGGRRRRSRRCAAWPRTRCCAALDNLVQCGAAHELLPAAGAAGLLDQGGQPQGRGHALAAAHVRDLRPLARCSRASTCAAARWRAAASAGATATTTSAPRSWA